LISDFAIQISNPKSEMTELPVIALTVGEPAGIGPDLCVLLAQAPRDISLVLIADPTLLHERAKLLHRPLDLAPWKDRASAAPGLHVLPLATACAVTPGRLDHANAPYVIHTLERAVDGCRQGEFDALVTGPVHKGLLNDSGIAFTGHTEFLAARCGMRQTVMMLACPDLRVALATTHLPLAEVGRRITPDLLTEVLTIIHTELQCKFGTPDPVILVCGLNPHAGESGHLGREEIDVIQPVLEALRANGMRLLGPVPADSAFIPSRLEDVDVVLAMYHDQGLAVVKHHDFAHAINITLGLPFVRTSVDHGTALELAGSGRADPTSLIAAIDMAVKLSSSRTATA
jgi:4-hydroxythreonine-4-phosphate dehydrogenase